MKWLFTVTEKQFTVAGLTFWMCWNENEYLAKWSEIRIVKMTKMIKKINGLLNKTN